VAPWLPVLLERFGSLVGQIRERAVRGEKPDPQTMGVARGEMVEMTREMAPAVFTPQRIDQLVADLKDYQQSLGQAGERQAALWAYGALASVRGEGSPADKPFLMALCFASLRAVIQ
jgi:hypothetical protein